MDVQPTPTGWRARLGGRARLLDPAPWRYLAGYFRGRAGLLALVSVLGVVQSAAMLPTLFFVRYAFDVAVPKGAITTLILIGVSLVIIRLAASALALVGRALSLKVTKRAIRDMRTDLLGTLYALPRDYFGRNDAARVQTRIVLETERLDNLTSIILSSILPSALASLLLGLVLLYLNPWLVLLLAALVPLVWLSTLLGGRYIKREVQTFQSAFERFSQGVQFVLRQMELTRVRGFEHKELERQSGKVEALERSGIRMAMSYAVHGQVQSNLTGLGGLLLLVGGGVAVAHQVMSLGDLLAFYLAAGLLNGNLSTITGIVPDVIAGNLSLSKLLALRQEEPETTYQGTRQIDFQGRLSLSGVTFGFGTAPLLEDVSLDLAPHEVTAIIGPNGAGKSTLINLLLGYYRPQSGTVSADGLAYEEIDLRHLRRSIGVVLQRPTFFTGTLADNIGYGWPEVPRETLEQAVRTAGAEPFVRGLTKGLDTVIGEGGALVSGGEAQKLAIARALIGHPRLLVLDEPTNHLDVEAIGQIMGRIANLPDRPAVLIISHDPTVIGFCDRVLRLTGRQLTPMTAADRPAASSDDILL